MFIFLIYAIYQLSSRLWKQLIYSAAYIFYTFKINLPYFDTFKVLKFLRIYRKNLNTKLKKEKIK